MNKSLVTTSSKSDNQTNIDQVLLMRYNSDLASINSRIQLRQNLFSFLLEGKKSVQYAEKQTTICTDQFLLLSAGNCLLSEKIAVDGGHYRSILLFFDNRLLADFFLRHSVKSQIKSKKNNEDPFLVFEKDAFLINFIESLGFMLDSGQPLSDEMKGLKLEELLLYLSAHYPEKIQQLRGFNYEVDDDLLIRQAITSNIYNAVTVEELAFLCHMSLSTFKRRFAKIYVSTPNKWLLEKRMEKAAYLLKQGECKVSEIYSELGYENLSSFIQSFKQVHGITPKQYQLSH